MSADESTSPIDQLDPILNRLIETVDVMFPNNKGVILALGLVDREDIIYVKVGGNGRTGYRHACQIVTDFTCEVGDLYGKTQGFNL